VQRGLDQRRVGDSPRRALDALAVPAAHDDAADALGALAVAHHGQRELAQERVERLAEAQLVLGLRLHGDPNWGRIVQAVGMALPGTAPLAVDVGIEGVQVCARGGAIGFDAKALAQAVARDEVEYVVELPGEGHETEVFFSDLSHEYVTINADYTT